MSEEEEAFGEFKNLVRIHLKQLLKLDDKPPIYSVALLVAIACEQLSKLFPAEGGKEDMFFRCLLKRHGVEESVGRDLFDVVRNGLAHSYTPKAVLLGGNERARTIFTWKGGPHLRAVGVRREGIHNRLVPIEDNEYPDQFLCIDVESLWRDLDMSLSEVEERLAGGDLSLEMAALMPTKGPIQATALKEWREFLRSRALHRSFPAAGTQDAEGWGP